MTLRDMQMIAKASVSLGATGYSIESQNKWLRRVIEVDNGNFPVNAPCVLPFQNNLEARPATEASDPLASVTVANSTVLAATSRRQSSATGSDSLLASLARSVSDSTSRPRVARKCLRASTGTAGLRGRRARSGTLADNLAAEKVNRGIALLERKRPAFGASLANLSFAGRPLNSLALNSLQRPAITADGDTSAQPLFPTPPDQERPSEDGAVQFKRLREAEGQLATPPRSIALEVTSSPGDDNFRETERPHKRKRASLSTKSVSFPDTENLFTPLACSSANRASTDAENAQGPKLASSPVMRETRANQALSPVPPPQLRTPVTSPTRPGLTPMRTNSQRNRSCAESARLSTALFFLYRPHASREQIDSYRRLVERESRSDLSAPRAFALSVVGSSSFPSLQAASTSPSKARTGARKEGPSCGFALVDRSRTDDIAWLRAEICVSPPNSPSKTLDGEPNPNPNSNSSPARALRPCSSSPLRRRAVHLLDFSVLDQLPFLMLSCHEQCPAANPQEGREQACSCSCSCCSCIDKLAPFIIPPP